MTKMTEKEKLVGKLYKKLLKAQKEYRAGNKNKDYEAIVYDLQEQINTLTNNNLSDGVISLRISGLNENTTRFNIIELTENEKIGEAIVNIIGDKASMNFTINKEKNEQENALRTLKQLCVYAKNNNVEEILITHKKENSLLNNTLDIYGAEKDSAKVSSYVEHIIKIK